MAFRFYTDGTFWWTWVSIADGVIASVVGVLVALKEGPLTAIAVAIALGSIFFVLAAMVLLTVTSAWKSVVPLL